MGETTERGCVPRERLFLRQMDRKGRVALPVALRVLFGETAVVTLGLHEDGPVVLVLTPERWAQLEAEGAERWDWWVLQGSTACEMRIDPNNHRIVIPHALRDVVGLLGWDEVVVRWINGVVEILPSLRFQAQLRKLLKQTRYYGMEP